MGALLQVIEEVIVVRGWDLGASFAGANLEPDTDVIPTIGEAIKRHLPNTWLQRQEQIGDAVFDLFRRPEPHEEKILADLGRIAFGVELITQAGRSALYALSLPEDVFLDTNVVLPLIVTGHPYHKTYSAAIRKLREAASKNGADARILVTDSFLNEVVSNRKIAMDLVTELSLEDEERLRRHILFFGADRVNVFVGAYATHVAKNRGASLPFEDFLNSVAPYSNEREAGEFLEAQGMAVVSSHPKSAKEQIALNELSMKLEAAYDAKTAANPSYYKPTILIKHEASQLALLAAARQAGRRAYFITADKKLRAIVGEEAFTGLRDALMSHMGFVQLIDLLVGIGVEPSSLARVFWSVRAIDEEGVLRNYILDLALKKYDAALLLDMGEVLDGTIRDATKSADLEDVLLMPSDVRDEDAGKTTRFLDRVEDAFFGEMAREMKRREEQKR
jgi:predicted nucleic acid-binding protein